MKIQIIEKEETVRSTKVVSNCLYKERFDLNTLYDIHDIENIKIVVTKSSKELEEKDKRFIKACGGYTPEKRIIRYILLFFLSSVFIQTLLLLNTKVYPDHFYKIDNTFTVISFVFVSSLFICVFGILFDSIFMAIRLFIFQRNEKKRDIK